MAVTGVVSFPGEGVAGSINAVIDAEDPRGLLRLLGGMRVRVDVSPYDY